jgi:hypothetical protein
VTATTVTMQASQEGCRARRARHGDGTVEDDTTRPVAQCQGRVLCHGPCHGPCYPCCVGGNNVTQSQHNSQHRGVNTSNQPRDVDTTWQYQFISLRRNRSHVTIRHDWSPSPSSPVFFTYFIRVAGNTLATQPK